MTTPSRPRYDGKSASGKPISQSLEERLAVLCNKAGVERPTWMSDKSLLPKRPPGKAKGEP